MIIWAIFKLDIMKCKKQIKELVIVALLPLLLSSCAQNQKIAKAPSSQIGGDFPFDKILLTDAPYEAPKLPVKEAKESEVKADLPREAIIFKGTGRKLKPLKAQKKLFLPAGDVELSFESTPLIEIVHAILGDILKQNYVVQTALAGKVTLKTNKPVLRSDLLTILETLLQANGASMVRDEENRFIVSKLGIASRLAPRLSNRAEMGAGYNTTVISLDYIGAAEMAEILAPVIGKSALIRADAKRNLLILAGTRAQMTGWLEMVKVFDVDQLKGMSVGIYPVENIPVMDMEAALNNILGVNGAKNVKGLLGMVSLFPLEHLASILVVTTKKHHLSQVGDWIRRLDIEPDSRYERRLYVYRVQNGTATHIAELISAVFSGGSSPAAKSSGSGVAPGLAQESISTKGGKSSASARQSSASSGSGASSYGIDNIGITADEENNALLIFATSKDYKKIKQALEKLDVLPAQVLIEASILEVTLTDALKYGVEWSMKNGLANDHTGTLATAWSESAPAAILPGLSYLVSNGSGTARAVVNMIEEESLVNVISTPSIMVMDNQTAEIKIGDQQPIRAGQTVTTGGNVVNSIEYKDTGVRLSVSPSINAGGVVTMDIEQSVTDVGPVDSATGQRSFLERNIKSRVAVRSGESVVLGGLIRENKSDSDSGIPFLYKIPYIGALFGKNSESGTRTELLVVITPHVMFNEQDIRDVGREMRQRIRGLRLLNKEQPQAVSH